MLADSALPKRPWGELMFSVAFLGNRAPTHVIGTQSPYKMLPGAEQDLCFSSVIGFMAFVHIETYSKTLQLKAVAGR